MVLSVTRVVSLVGAEADPRKRRRNRAPSQKAPQKRKSSDNFIEVPDVNIENLLILKICSGLNIEKKQHIHRTVKVTSVIKNLV